MIEFRFFWVKSLPFANLNTGVFWIMGKLLRNRSKADTGQQGPGKGKMSIKSPEGLRFFGTLFFILIEPSTKILTSDQSKLSVLLNAFSDLESNSPILKEPKKAIVMVAQTTIFVFSDQFFFAISWPKIYKRGSVIAFLVGFFPIEKFKFSVPLIAVFTLKL